VTKVLFVQIFFAQWLNKNKTNKINIKISFTRLIQIEMRFIWIDWCFSFFGLTVCLVVEIGLLIGFGFFWRLRRHLLLSIFSRGMYPEAKPNSFCCLYNNFLIFKDQRTHKLHRKKNSKQITEQIFMENHF
jgi:hypothetical protein